MSSVIGFWDVRGVGVCSLGCAILETDRNKEAGTFFKRKRGLRKGETEREDLMG